MAVNVLLENNLLIIDEGTANAKYFNAAWCTIDFTDTHVIITDEGRGEDNSRTIAFTDFTYDGVAATTKTAIATVLSDKIGV